MMISKYDLTTNELLVLHSEMKLQGKSLGIAYLMLLGGHLGLHRFYLKRYATGITQLAMFIGFIIWYIVLAVFSAVQEQSVMSIIILTTLMIIFMGSLTIWLFVDLFLLPGYIREWNEKVEQEIMQQIVQYRVSQQESL